MTVTLYMFDPEETTWIPCEADCPVCGQTVYCHEDPHYIDDAGGDELVFIHPHCWLDYPA